MEVSGAVVPVVCAATEQGRTADYAFERQEFRACGATNERWRIKPRPVYAIGAWLPVRSYPMEFMVEGPNEYGSLTCNAYDAAGEKIGSGFTNWNWPGLNSMTIEVYGGHVERLKCAVQGPTS
jgi:hypothetical protein